MKNLKNKKTKESNGIDYEFLYYKNIYSPYNHNIKNIENPFKPELNTPNTDTEEK